MVSNEISLHGAVTLREQAYYECRAMARYALERGKKISPSIFEFIDSIELKGLTGDIDIAKLINTHNELALIVEPATPHTILFMNQEFAKKESKIFLSNIPIVRRMMLATIASVLFFLIAIISPDSSDKGMDILTSSTVCVLINIIFYLASAGVGASFFALYMINDYISKGSFDPAYSPSYWIRFFLGLISGLVLSLVVSDDALKEVTFLEQGLIRPLLAMLGGFSAEVVYTLLTRLVEALKALFQGSTQNIIEAKSREMKAQLSSQQVKTQMKLANNLTMLKNEIAQTPESKDIQNKLDKLIQELAS
jgi:hypothetical protein